MSDEQDSSSNTYVFVDRYGGDYPDPDTVCRGQCEGLGYYPQNIDDPNATEAEKASVAHMLNRGDEPDEHGTLFITCPDCDGTGKRKITEDVT